MIDGRHAVPQRRRRPPQRVLVIRNCGRSVLVVAERGLSRVWHDFVSVALGSSDTAARTRARSSISLSLDLSFWGRGNWCFTSVAAVAAASASISARALETLAAAPTRPPIAGKKAEATGLTSTTAAHAATERPHSADVNGRIAPDFMPWFA